MAAADHLVVSYGLYTHHAIDIGDGTVVGFSKASGAISRMSFTEFCDGREVSVRDYARCDSVPLVVERALLRVGETGYNLIVNNCEHFARWCKTGDHASEQVKDVAASGTGSVGAAVAAKAALGGIAAVGTAAGLSGAAGTMSGLAAAGGLIGGGVVAGIGLVGAAPATVATVAMQVVLKDDDKLSSEEREARKIGRVASVGGAAVGVAGAIGAVSATGSVAGLSAAGITSGLAAIGGTVGGGMAAGLVITTAAPAVAAVALGYGVYRLAKWLRS